MKLKKCAALLLVSSCLLTGCTTSSAKKVDSKYVVASLEKGNKTKVVVDREGQEVEAEIEF